MTFIHKNISYDTLLEAVDVSYPDNNICSYNDAITKHQDDNEIEKIHDDDLKIFTTKDYYDFERNTIKTESDLLKEFQIVTKLK